MTQDELISKLALDPIETYTYPINLFHWDRKENTLNIHYSNLISYRRTVMAKYHNIDLNVIHPSWIAYWKSKEESFIIQGKTKDCLFSYIGRDNDHVFRAKELSIRVLVRS